MRKEIDMALLVQAIIALGKQLERERRAREAQLVVEPADSAEAEPEEGSC
jgi:hypothetical protein